MRLARSLEDGWREAASTRQRGARETVARRTGVTLDAYAVSRMVNTPRADGREWIGPVESTGWSLYLFCLILYIHSSASTRKTTPGELAIVYCIV